jgi:steroid Delta-isomerase
MTDADPKIACVHAYIAAFDSADASAAASLFADDATLEDPFGSAAIRGNAAIHEFYARAMQGGAKLALTGPPRLAGDAVAFPFTANVPAANIAIDIIDVFRFDADGKVASMQAFWGPGNVRTA